MMIDDPNEQDTEPVDSSAVPDYQRKTIFNLPKVDIVSGMSDFQIAEYIASILEKIDVSIQQIEEAIHESETVIKKAQARNMRRVGILSNMTYGQLDIFFRIISESKGLIGKVDHYLSTQISELIDDLNQDFLSSDIVDLSWQKKARRDDVFHEKLQQIKLAHSAKRERYSRYISMLARDSALYKYITFALNPITERTPELLSSMSEMVDIDVQTRLETQVLPIDPSKLFFSQVLSNQEYSFVRDLRMARADLLNQSSVRVPILSGASLILIKLLFDDIAFMRMDQRQQKESVADLSVKVLRNTQYFRDMLVYQNVYNQKGIDERTLPFFSRDFWTLIPEIYEALVRTLWAVGLGYVES